MPVAYPIYGFHVTKPLHLTTGVIRPRTSNYETAQSWSRDLKTFYLTGLFITEDALEDFVFNLETTLAFIEQLDVLIGAPAEYIETDPDPFSNFDLSLQTPRHNNGGGAMIGEDTFFPDSREKFLQQVLQKLQDRSFCDKTQFKQLFFKCVEQFRQRKRFVEVSYFFLFSGLETFARTVMNDRKSGAAVPIEKLLKSYGFDVSVDRQADLVRAVSTYAHLRNALFHNGEFIAEVNYNGNLVRLRLFDYLFNFTQLTNLVVLKAIQFDDGHINWNSWVDRQS